MHKERNVDPVSTTEGIALRAGGGMQREKIMEKKKIRLVLKMTYCKVLEKTFLKR